MSVELGPHIPGHVSTDALQRNVSGAVLERPRPACEETQANRAAVLLSFLTPKPMNLEYNDSLNSVEMWKRYSASYPEWLQPPPFTVIDSRPVSASPQWRQRWRTVKPMKRRLRIRVHVHNVIPTDAMTLNEQDVRHSVWPATLDLSGQPAAVPPGPLLHYNGLILLSLKKRLHQGSK